jgi:hypothetical protein
MLMVIGKKVRGTVIGAGALIGSNTVVYSIYMYYLNDLYKKISKSVKGDAKITKPSTPARFIKIYHKIRNTNILVSGYINRGEKDIMR